MKKKQKCLLFGIFLVMGSTAVAQPVTVYGVKEGIKYRNWNHSSQSYLLQVAVFRQSSNARRMQETIKSLTSYPVQIIPHHRLYRVVIGPINSAQDLNSLSAKIASLLQQKAPTKAPKRTDVKPKAIALSKSEPVAANYSSSQPQFIASIGAAKAWTSSNNFIHVANGSSYPTPYDTDKLTVNSPDTYSVAVTIGKEWPQTHKYIDAIDFALRYQHFVKKQFSGQIIQYSLPEFTNYRYQWDASSNTLSAYTKVLFNLTQQLKPYISAGAGIAFNQLNNYQETALANVTARISPNFADNKSTQFTYSLGAGIDWWINSAWRFGFGYEFQDLGKFGSANGTGSQWLNTSLNMPSIKTHSALINVQKLFN